MLAGLYVYKSYCLWLVCGYMLFMLRYIDVFYYIGSENWMDFTQFIYKIVFTPTQKWHFNNMCTKGGTDSLVLPQMSLWGEHIHSASLTQVHI